MGVSFTMSEKLLLRWQDFQPSAASAFVNLREDIDFADITPACEDGEQVEAHKVILAASSPFFQSLFRRNKHPHPLLYMRGMSSNDLSPILDFLYFGETKVTNENLNAFLAIAQELQLKGLPRNTNRAENRNFNDEKVFLAAGQACKSNIKIHGHIKAEEKQPKQKSSYQKKEVAVEQIKSKYLNDSNNDLNQLNDVEQPKQELSYQDEEMAVEQIKSKYLIDSIDALNQMNDVEQPKQELSYQEKEIGVEQIKSKYIIDSIDALEQMNGVEKPEPEGFTGSLEELEEVVNSMMERSTKMHKNGKHKAHRCVVCGKEDKGSNIRAHIETNHLPGLVINCGFCDLSFRRSTALKQHIAEFHGSLQDQQTSSNKV